MIARNMSSITNDAEVRREEAVHRHPDTRDLRRASMRSVETVSVDEVEVGECEAPCPAAST
jgi:hypothetical protein